MAQLPNAFNAAEVPPSDDFSALPAGDYRVIVEDSEMKQTKAGTGQYLQLTYNVLDGQYAGRKLWDRLNLVNPNSTAVEIAQRSLSAICHATGVINLTDSAQLHGKVLVAKVGMQKDSDRNEIKGYKKADGSAIAAVNAATPAPAAPAAPAPQPAAQTAPAGNRPPWAQ